MKQILLHLVNCEKKFTQLILREQKEAHLIFFVNENRKRYPYRIIKQLTV